MLSLLVAKMNWWIRHQFIRRRGPTKRIALVGNGPVRPGLGAEIDAHDLVIRFNAATSHGLTGYRTDVLVLTNTGKPAARFAADLSAINNSAFIRAAEIWFTKHPKVIWAALRICPPEDRESWTDFSGEIIRHRLAGKPFRYLSARSFRHAEALLRPLGMQRGMEPSSGMLVIADIDRRNKSDIDRRELRLYGFTHQGWCRHPWSAESAFIKAAPWITKAREMTLYDSVAPRWFKQFRYRLRLRTRFNQLRFGLRTRTISTRRGGEALRQHPASIGSPGHLNVRGEV